MRKVILDVSLSLDGYIARLNGDVDFLFRPKNYSMAAFFASVDTGIMGRKTLEAGLRMGGGKFPVSSIKMYAMSRTKPPEECDGYAFVNDSPSELVARIRKRPGKNIWLVGGGELAREFLKEDLVDELHLRVVPVLLGEGIPLFPGEFPQRAFALVENKAYSQGLVELKYERARKPARK